MKAVRNRPTRRVARVRKTLSRSRLHPTGAARALACLIAVAAAADRVTCQVTDPARFASYGDPCGPSLGGADQIVRDQHALTFDVTGAVPNAPVALFLGSAQADWPLPGTTCRSLTNMLFSLPGFAGRGGTAQFAFGAPGSFEGLVFAQALSLDVNLPGVFGSNGLEVLFPGVSPTPDPTTHRDYPCYYIQSFNWNYGGDGVGVVTGKIRWPSSTCSASDGPPADRPVVIFTHGNGMSHTDHDYLMAHLARNGFVTASVANGGFMGSSNEGRARQAISFLNSLHAFWGWRSRLSNKVVFAGHSRGGEAAVTAARLIDEIASLSHVPYDVRAVISIAPTDGGGDNSDPKETLRGSASRSFLGIYGSKDPDVRGMPLDQPLNGPENTVFAIYDRAGSETSSEGILNPNLHLTKAMVFVHGATHRGFLDTCNPVLGGGDVSCAEHRDIAKAYFNAFLRWHVLNETAYRCYFDGTAVPTSIRVTDVELFNQLSDLRRRVVDNFEQGGWDDNTIGGSVYQSAGIAQLAEAELWQLDSSAPQDTGGMRIKWRNSPLPYVRWQIPNDNVPFVGPARDVTSYQFLSLRVAQNYRDAWNVEGQDQDFRVRLYTGSGWSASVRISEFGRIPYPDEWIFTPLNAQLGDFTKSALNTVRLPLSAFAGADLTDVRYVYFYFDVPGHAFGSVNVDNLEFAN